MVWDFRVIRRRIGGKDVYQVHRVYYADSTKRAALCIENSPASIVGPNARTMLEDVELLTNAFDQPTLYIPEWNIGE